MLRYLCAIKLSPMQQTFTRHCINFRKSACLALCLQPLMVIVLFYLALLKGLTAQPADKNSNK